MNKLPMISGRECIATLVNAGFYIKRRESSHVILRRVFRASFRLGTPLSATMRQINAIDFV